MNPRIEGTEVRRSERHGRGLFAERRFRRGEFLGLFQGSKTRRDGTYVLWLIDEEGEAFGIRGQNDLRFMNHSSQPNAEFRDAEVVVIRAIRPGDEITVHYGDDWGDVD